MTLSSGDLKRSLSAELGSVVKAALKEDNGEAVSADVLASVCNVVEAIFIHGLKSIHFLSSKNVKYPEPNLWQLLAKFSPRGLKQSIAGLSQIRTEVGRSRAWIRQALNDGVLENYLQALAADRATLRLFYHKTAYLLDGEQSDVLRNYVRALSRLPMEAPTNSALLNQWTPTPLRLAGLLNKPRPLLSGMAEMDAVLEEVGEAGTVATAEDALDLLGSTSSRPDSDSDASTAASLGPAQRRPFPGYQGGYQTSEAGESSVLSHPSLVDDKFQAIMKEMASRRSGSSGPRGDEELFDSGISPDINHANQVVVKRRGQTSSSMRRRALRSRASETPPPAATDSASDIARRFPSLSEAGQGSTSATAQEATQAQVKPEATASTLELSKPAEEPPEEADAQESSSAVPLPILPRPTEEELEADPCRPRSLADELASPMSPTKSTANEESYVTAVEGAEDADETRKTEFLSPLPASKSSTSMEASYSSAVEDGYSPGNSIGKGASWWSGGEGSSALAGSLAPSTPGDSEYGGGRTSRGSTFCETLTQQYRQEDFGQLLTATLERYEQDPPPATPTLEAGALGEPASASTPTPPDPQDSSVSPAFLDEFDIVGEAEGERAVEKSPEKEEDWRFGLITRLAEEAGLDAQEFRCRTCRRNIGLLYGEYRVCAFDGRAYCTDCHRNDSVRLPARVLLSWDLEPRKVCRASKAFLEHVGDRPVIRLDQANSSLYDHAPAMGEVLELRRELGFVAAYLLSCKESVAAELGKRLWPKDYLHSDLHLYSANDLVWAWSGGMGKQLRWVVEWAEGHVLSCALCSQKGFICECGQPPVVFPFQLSLVHRCEDCGSVSHKACGEARPCAVCQRRRAYARTRAESHLDDSHIPSFAEDE